MGRAPCCEKVGLKRGRWTADEDEILASYIAQHGEGAWRSLPKDAGLLRCGKSCRLRWINYLRAGVRRGNISKEEDDVIVKLHATLGNRWSLIASHLPGRTDNEIKNYWNSHLSRQIHTFRRMYTASNDTPVTIDIKKLSAAGTAGQSPKSSSKKQPEPEPTTKAKGASSPAATASAASSPPQIDGARSAVVDPDKSQPNNNSTSVSHTPDGPCSEDATGSIVLDPTEQIGLWEADSVIDQTGLWEADDEMEALLFDGVGTDSWLTGLETMGQAPVDDLLDMDWEGFAAHLWGEPSQSDLLQAGEPKAMMGCDSDELESFESWLLSDSCEKKIN